MRRTNISSKPLISIVLPAYNAAKYLPVTCQSVLSQTYKSLELIIVDDHSSDRTLAIAQDLAASDNRVRVYRTPANCGGPAGPRNLGVSHASGEYIAFIDSDDWWHYEKLSVQLNVLDASGAAMCSTRSALFTDHNDLQNFPVLKPPLYDLLTFGGNRIKNKIVTSSVLLPRTRAIAHRFNEARDYAAVEDYDCWLRVLDDGAHCARIVAPLTGYRVSDGQISQDKIAMARKVFMVHRNFGRASSRLLAPLYAITHVAYGVLEKLLRITRKMPKNVKDI